MIVTLSLVFFGGLGAVARFVGDGLLRTVFGRDFPWATMIINSIGAFILGGVTAYALQHDASTVKLVIGTGFCGGFTTFSTASFESVRLIEAQRFSAFAVQMAGNLLLSLAAAALGFAVHW